MEIAVLLINAGADTDCRDKVSISALDESTGSEDRSGSLAGCSKEGGGARVAATVTLTVLGGVSICAC